MLKTKYIFLKRLYQNDLIIFIKNRKFYYLDNDLLIIKYFNNLDKYHINYILLNDLDIVYKKVYTDNRYIEYLYKSLIINMYINYKNDEP